MSKTNTTKSKRVLVLRDSARPEFAYAMLGMSIFIWLWMFGAYASTRDLTEPILMADTLLHKGSYFVIDSDSYRVFLIPAIITSIITTCCFRFTKKERSC